MIGAKILPKTACHVKDEMKIILGRENLNFGTIEDDFVVFEADDLTADITRIIVMSKAIKGLYLTVGIFELHKKEDLYNHTHNIEWHLLFPTSLSFAVIPKGKNIDRVEVGRLVGQGIVDEFQRSIRERPKVDLKHPDVRIIARISNERLILSIDLIGRQLNTIEEIANRILALSSDLHGRFGEIYHTGICESYFEIANLVPQKDRILDTTFVDMLFIDQETIINILNTPPHIRHTEVSCYDDHNEGGNKYPIKYRDLEALRVDPIDGLASNLTLRFPTRIEQRKAIDTILRFLADNNSWKKLSIACRHELGNLFDKFSPSVLASINIMGINSTILEVARG